MRRVSSFFVAPLVLLGTACGGGGAHGAGPAGALEFSGLSYPVGIGPADLRMADMDCDGLLDIVALCPGDSSISIRRHALGDAHSNPVYSDARHILLPDSARDFCIADVDGDGRPDLVAITGDPDFDLIVLHSEAGAADVLFNPKEYSISKAAASRVAAADVNGDGKVDLVLLDETTGAVALVLNDPKAPGTFLVPAVQLPSFGGACSELAVGDLDGDGLLDVMTLTAGDGAFSYLRQSPAGTFKRKAWLPANFRIAQHFAVGDLDGDGHLDVVLSRSIPENGVEYLPLFQDPTSPSGFRESPAQPSTGPTTKAMRLADVNRDGLLDLVAAEADLTGETTVAVYVGDPSSPSRMKKGTVKFFNEAKGFGRALAVADVNGDGFLDFVLADSRRDVVNVLLRRSAPPVPPTFVRGLRLDAPAGVTWADVKLGDLDGDGKEDIVVGGSDGITAFFQDPAAPGTFLPGQTVPVGVAVTSIQLADVDGDGRLDVAFAGTGAAGDACGVLWKHHDVPGFDPPTSIPVASAGGVAVGDVNGDGLSDLVCAVGKHDAAMAAIQNTRRNFAPGFEVPTGGSSVALALADLDCDGRADLAAVNADGTLSLVRHAPGFPPPGPGLFLAPQTMLFAGGVRVAAGDVNGDGAMDLVTVDGTGVKISTQGASDGSTVQWPSVFKMATLTVTGTPGGSAQVALADVDRDGRLDIVEGGADGGGFRVFRNDPTATDGFSMHVYQHNQTDLDFLSVAIGDVNGDGWVDAVTATGPAPGEVGGHLFLWTQVPGPH